tara:strand:- start:3829 stop:4260 length:432 start_codon:yes stop_codon:yes gene_type:complete
MKILTTSTSNQTLSFLPREYPSTVKMTLRDNSTNATTTVDTLTLSKNNDNASITNAFTLVEGRFYDLNIIKGQGQLWNTLTTQWQLVTDNWENIISSEIVIYKDKIFCTDQTIDQLNDSYYDINSGEYTETTSYPDDDYLIIS